MSNETPSYGSAIEKFISMVEDGDVHIFTKEDVNILKELAHEKDVLKQLVALHKRSPGALSAWVWFYDFLKNIAFVGGGLQKIFMWLLFMIGAWATLQGHTVTLIKQMFGMSR